MTSIYHSNPLYTIISIIYSYHLQGHMGAIYHLRRVDPPPPHGPALHLLTCAQRLARLAARLAGQLQEVDGATGAPARGAAAGHVETLRELL